MMKHLQSIGLILILGILLGLLGFSIWDKPPLTVTVVNWSKTTSWIQPIKSDYRFYARRSFNIIDNGVEQAWIRLSADNDFTLYINGIHYEFNPSGSAEFQQRMLSLRRRPKSWIVAQEISTPRNSLGIATNLSDLNQKLNDSQPYSGLIPDWLQIANPKDWLNTYYVDLTYYLHPGRNSIGIEVQKSKTSPRLIVEGEIKLTSYQNSIDLSTGSSPWRISQLPTNQQRLQWFDADYNDESWNLALPIPHMKETTYSRLSPHLFNHKVAGNWITGEINHHQIWLRKFWNLTKTPHRAWIRFSGDGEYSVLINGKLVKTYGIEDQNDLHIFEISKLLTGGNNIIAVRITPVIDEEWSSFGKELVKPDQLTGFILDGWVENLAGKMEKAIATDDSWSSLSQPIFLWNEQTNVKPITIIRAFSPQEVIFKYETEADLLNYPLYLLHQILWVLGGIVLVVWYAGVSGWVWLCYQNAKKSNYNIFYIGGALLMPATLYLIILTLLKHRYAEAERGLIFAKSMSNPVILLSFILVLLLTWLWYELKHRRNHLLEKTLIWFNLSLVSYLILAITGGSSNFIYLFLTFASAGGVVVAKDIQWFSGFNKTMTIDWKLWGDIAMWLVILIIAIFLRVYRLGLNDLDPDENVSFDATLSILKNGVPISASGIWYTRGPFYHYQLALWLMVFGHSAISAKLNSVTWAILTLIIAYILTYSITKKKTISIIVVILLAIDPWELWYSRNIRFYQVSQCLNLLIFWSYLQGFIDPKGRWYQYVFFISLTLSLLTQEVTLILTPIFIIGFLFCYRPFKLKEDWPIIVGSIMVIIIFGFNILVFQIKCLTPLPGLSSMTIPFIKFHIGNIVGFSQNFLVGFNRTNTIYTLFFMIGAINALYHKNTKQILLYANVIVTLIVTTLMVVLIFMRYMYPVYPLLIIGGVYGAFTTAKSIGTNLEILIDHTIGLKNIALALTYILLFSNLEPSRILNSYQESITARHQAVNEYILQHKNPDDLVLSNVPSVHAISLGGVDYYVPHRMSFFDATYWNDGRLLDRWEGGQVVTNVDQLNHILAKSKRLWIHLFDRPLLPKDVDLAEFYTQLQTTGKLVFNTYGTKLYLWDPNDSLLLRFPNQGKDMGSY